MASPEVVDVDDDGGDDDDDDDDAILFLFFAFPLFLPLPPSFYYQLH